MSKYWKFFVWIMWSKWGSTDTGKSFTYTKFIVALVKWWLSKIGFNVSPCHCLHLPSAPCGNFQQPTREYVTFLHKWFLMKKTIFSLYLNLNVHSCQFIPSWSLKWTFQQRLTFSFLPISIGSISIKAFIFHLVFIFDKKHFHWPDSRCPLLSSFSEYPDSPPEKLQVAWKSV